MARDATPAPRTTPCTQPCSPIVDIANAPAREAGTAWCRRPDSSSHRSSGNDAARDTLYRGMAHRDVVSMTGAGISSAAYTRRRR
jgi:hypothetical protein